VKSNWVLGRTVCNTTEAESLMIEEERTFDCTNCGATLHIQEYRYVRHGGRNHCPRPTCSNSRTMMGLLSSYVPRPSEKQTRASGKEPNRESPETWQACVMRLRFHPFEPLSFAHRGRIKRGPRCAGCGQYFLEARRCCSGGTREWSRRTGVGSG
jgi:hypothetical protein